MDHIRHLAYRLAWIRQKHPDYFNEPAIELMFAFAYATQPASNIINQSLKLLIKRSLPIPCDIESLIKKVYLFSEKRILTTKEMNWGALQTDYETLISDMLKSDTMKPDCIERLTMVYTDWRTPDNFSSPGSFFKAVPPISLCLEEKKTEVDDKKLYKAFYDNEHIIPVNLRAPYK